MSPPHLGQAFSLKYVLYISAPPYGTAVEISEDLICPFRVLRCLCLPENPFYILGLQQDLVASADLIVSKDAGSYPVAYCVRMHSQHICRLLDCYERHFIALLLNDIQYYKIYDNIINCNTLSSTCQVHATLHPVNA